MSAYTDETHLMGLVRITSWYPNFNGSHFGLPPSEIHRMIWLPPGEVFPSRRIISKAIMRVVEMDVLKVTAPIQVCVGVPSACEAAVHSMERLFQDDETEGLLLMDATNAFNSLNRSAALHNIPRICPALAQVFTNTYQNPIRLFVCGGGEISSCEVTCQGDPLAMAI